MPTIRPLSLILCFTTLASCSTGPNYTRPDIPLTAHYINQPQLGLQSAVDKQLTAWWNDFHDPLMARLVTQALEQNLDLAQATARVSQARSGLSMANVALLPSANINAQAARSYQSVETPLGQVLNSTDPNFSRYGSAYDANLSASWELDLFGGLRRNREAALAQYQSSEAGEAATRLAIAAQTADTYIAIRALQARIAIAQKQVETRQQLLNIVSQLYSRGAAAELQMHQAEGSLAQVQATIPALNNGLDAAMNALDVLLGVQPGTNRQVLANSMAIPTPPTIEGIGSPADLIRRRPDLIAAEQRLIAANALIGAAISEYYPKLSLGALTGSSTAISGNNLFSSGANQTSGVLGLRWRLFDFGRVNAEIAAARGQKAESLASYRQAVLKATEDVENAFSGVINSKAQAAILTKGEISLQNARDASGSAYKNGAVSLIEVLQADSNLLAMSDAKIQSQADSAHATVATFRALGGGWQQK